MRRFLPVLLLILIPVVFSGCADLASLLPTPEPQGPMSAYVTPTPEPRFPEQMPTAARILERGEMVVGVRYDLEPFSYITEDSELAGLEIDLARELARRWLGDADAVRFRQVRSDSAYQHLDEGTVDFVLAGVTHTQEDEARADFSPPYFVNGLALLTFPETGIQSAGDLAQRRVGVVGWTGTRQELSAATDVITDFVTYDNFFDAVEGLRTRQVDAYADSRHRLERARRMVAGTAIVGQMTQEPVALVYRQNDPFFANLVAFTFQDLARDGTRDTLYARWLPGTSPPAIGFVPDNTPTPALSMAPTQLATLDVIGRIRARGTVAVGYFTDRWPYSADRADGVPTGFEVRLFERVVERWLGSRQAITFVPVTAADGFDKLARGEVDVLMGGWYHTRAAELQADFSIPILDDGVSLFSRAAAPIRDFEALAGQRVGIVSGSSAEAVLQERSQALGIGISPVTYPNVEAALAGLNGGEITAILGERRALLDILFRQPGYTITTTRFNTRPVAYVLPQGDSAYRDMVNLTLMTLYRNGTYRELYDLWFDEPTPALTVLPGNPALPLVIEGVSE